MTNPVGRRRDARLRLRLAARVITRAGRHHVVLCDLSRQGASVLAALPFDCRGPAVLQWRNHELFGEIQWSEGRRIGIRFDEPVPQAVLLEARRMDTIDRLPDDGTMVREQAPSWVQGVHRL